jgi:hypothetical protein
LNKWGAAAGSRFHVWEDGPETVRSCCCCLLLLLLLLMSLFVNLHSSSSKWDVFQIWKAGCNKHPYGVLLLLLLDELGYVT